MRESLEVSYHIDAADRISAVSDGWSAFARANSGEALLPPSVLGRSLWESISGETTRDIYRGLIARVREGRGPVHFQFRCDAPAMQRLLDMRMTLTLAGGVSFLTVPVTLEQRPSVALLDPSAVRSPAAQVSCGWCARLRVAEREWLEVEPAMRILDPFGLRALPRLSHGMCPDCFEAMKREMEEPSAVDAPISTLGDFTPA